MERWRWRATPRPVADVGGRRQIRAEASAGGVSDLPPAQAAGAPMSGPVQPRSADVWRRAGDAPPPPAQRCSRTPILGGDARLLSRAALLLGDIRRAAARATPAPGLSSPSQVPEVARVACRHRHRPPRPEPIRAAARPLYFIRCSGDRASRRLLEYTYRVGGDQRSRGVLNGRRRALTRTRGVVRARGAAAATRRAGSQRRRYVRARWTRRQRIAVSHTAITAPVDDRCTPPPLAATAPSLAPKIAHSPCPHLHWSSNSPPKHLNKSSLNWFACIFRQPPAAAVFLSASVRL